MSAGGIVYTDARSVSRLERRDKKESGQIFILLVLTAGVTETTEQKWTFPKGRLGDHGDETMKAVAVREVREEGGVTGEIQQDLGEVKYFYKFKGENIFKIVHWYLMEYVSGDPGNHDHEVLEAKWFELSQVAETLVYKTDKEIFEKARRLISNF